jgi:alpha/beta superfamily hydrolase
VSEPWKIRTEDGLTLEAEFAAPPAGVTPWLACVLCHPHPQHGGSMRSIIISSLFEALPAAGVACVRFNYRGVGESEGSYGDGIGEQVDARAAIDTLLRSWEGHIPPLAVVGWSFGADVTMALADPRAAALVAIAPPLRTPDRVTGLVIDPRPKLVLIAANDEVIDNTPARTLAPTWPNTTVEEIPGASHYFVGRTDRVISQVLEFLKNVAHS